MKRTRFSLILLGAALTFALPALARASEPISAFSLGSSNTQAGGHPDLDAFLRLDSPGQPEVAKSLTIDMPQGVFGNPNAIPTCSSLDFTLSQCGSGSQVGLITLRGYAGPSDTNHLYGTAPVYDLDTQTDSETARFAFVIPGLAIPITIPVSVRTSSDYGLRLNIEDIPQQFALSSAHLVIWGFPADADHDASRFPKGSPGNPPGCPGSEDASCVSAPYPRAGVVPVPMIDNPSVCTGSPLPVGVSVITYQDGSHPSTATAEYPATTGCEGQVFYPSLSASLTSTEADSPSGLDLQLRAAQILAVPPSPSQLRSVSVTLPQGLSINPDAADGQSACTDAQAAFDTDAPSNCPDNAKIGTVELHTPALTGPLTGSLYFGEPHPGDQYRVFMILDGFGIHAKLFVDVRPDPTTGQLTMTVTDLPQVPFEEFDIHLFASDRGLIATPVRCAVYEVDSTFVPWNDKLAPQRANPILSIRRGPNDSDCPGEIRPFHPRLVAGTSSAVAGAFSAFTLRLDRDDGDQFLGDLNFKLPPGFTGSLRGITYCPEASISVAAQNTGRAEQASPSCPASSQIGTTNVAAGPGSHPFHAVGRMYLTGPLDGAPLSLAAITPALAGPYDYGVVVVRVALHVDPADAHVFAVSDSVPQIIGGVPIRMRSIQVNIDRPRFTINPTNCAPFSVESQGIGNEGAVAAFSSYFQVVNCASLPFKPKMTIRQLGGQGGTRRSADPSLAFDLTTRPGDANIKSVAVTLPRAFEIDTRHLSNLCTEKLLLETQCAGNQPIGRATTTTPLLDQPLSGLVYAVSGSGLLPRLAFLLNGQVSLLPRAETKQTRAGLRTVVPAVPDAPIGHFHLQLFGGGHGYLTNTRSLCAQKAVVRLSYLGQNGKKSSEPVRVRTACPRANSAHSRR